MKLIFIRHGEPDYKIDSLTDKGWREARLLAERTAKWDVTDFYCSPLGRARDTASFTLKNAGREAEIMPWLREFDSFVNDPVTGRKRIAWDLLPEYLNANPGFFDRELWLKTAIMDNGTMERDYAAVCDGIDGILARYGYMRDGLIYRAGENANRDAVVVCFCHFGVTCTILSHILNISPIQLWHGFFFAPTSVTILGTEERNPGEVYFRCQAAGDVSHLISAGEPISYYGYFTEPFQENLM